MRKVFLKCIRRPQEHVADFDKSCMLKVLSILALRIRARLSCKITTFGEQILSSSPYCIFPLIFKRKRIRKDRDPKKENMEIALVFEH